MASGAGPASPPFKHVESDGEEDPPVELSPEEQAALEAEGDAADGAEAGAAFEEEEEDEEEGGAGGEAGPVRPSRAPVVHPARAAAPVSGRAGALAAPLPLRRAAAERWLLVWRRKEASPSLAA